MREIGEQRVVADEHHAAELLVERANGSKQVVTIACPCGGRRTALRRPWRVGVVQYAESVARDGAYFGPT